MRRLVLVIGSRLPSSVSLAGAADRRPRILLSDDDGIAAAGLLAAYEELAKIGEVTVAAPAENQSGVGHGITYREPILMKAIDPLVKVEGPQGPWYRIEAKPATCVRLALASLLTEKPDLVVSGINRGDNAGLDPLRLGDAGGRPRGRLRRNPLDRGEPGDLVDMGSGTRPYRPGAALLGRIAARGPEARPAEGHVPVPQLPGQGDQGACGSFPTACAAGLNQYDRRVNPEDQTYFWNIWTEPADPDPMTDAGALREGYATVTAAAHRRQRPRCACARSRAGDCVERRGR